jgi:hypothetical protein
MNQTFDDQFQPDGLDFAVMGDLIDAAHDFLAGVGDLPVNDPEGRGVGNACFFFDRPVRLASHLQGDDLTFGFSPPDGFVSDVFRLRQIHSGR